MIMTMTTSEEALNQSLKIESDSRLGGSQGAAVVPPALSRFGSPGPSHMSNRDDDHEWTWPVMVSMMIVT